MALALRLRTGALLLAALVLGGCSAAPVAGGASPAVPASDAPAEPGADLGNGLPRTSYDGPFVQRRVVLAIFALPDADLDRLRAGVMTLSADPDDLTEVAPQVLSANILETAVPDLAIALPAGATLVDASRIVTQSALARLGSAGLDHSFLADAFVHDVRFVVETVTPHALADTLEAEGILADSLGNYSTRASSHRLAILYLGPLLSDESVDTVLSGMARATGLSNSVVNIEPRTPNGTGVELDAEVAAASAASTVRPTDGHGHPAPAADPTGTAGGAGTTDTTDTTGTTPSIVVEPGDVLTPAEPGPWARYATALAIVVLAAVAIVTSRDRPIGRLFSDARGVSPRGMPIPHAAVSRSPRRPRPDSRSR